MLFKIAPQERYGKQFYVIADNWQGAIRKWKSLKLKDHNDSQSTRQISYPKSIEDMDEPAGIALIAREVIT